MVIDNTPYDCYKVDDVDVMVKREDLCSPYPGPMFSKVRGLAAHLETLKASGVTTVGVLDTYHSKAGWGTAWLCRQLNMTCINYYPEYKHDKAMRLNQQMAQSFGAILTPIAAGRSFILWQRAKKLLAESHPGASMLPNGLNLIECETATANELIATTAPALTGGTFIVSVSSGTLAAGVARGLFDMGGRARATKLILHLGYSRSVAAVTDRVNYLPHLTTVIDEGYAYRDASNAVAWFPCNPYYDLKAWAWLTSHIHELKPPIVFWNIGA